MDIHLLLDNRHHAVGGYCSVDLDSYGILAHTPEFFNLQVLPQSFEEQLYLTPVVVQFGYLQRAYIQGICEEDESPAGLRIQVQYPSDLLKIFAHCQLATNISYGIGHDTGGQPALPSHGLEVIVLLAPDHEVCTHTVNGE